MHKSGTRPVSTGSNSPLRIGLTGGIASGKSAAADHFRALGVPVIDTDVIAREVVEPGQPALGQIESAFGEGVINEDGSLDRARLRQRIFADAAARKELEGILHPRIRKEAMRQAASADGDYQVLVVPLLAESPLKNFVNRVLVIDCEESTQVERLMARDGETRKSALRMLAAQTSREQRLAIADDVIQNERGLRDLRREVERLHASYVALAGRNAESP